MTSQNTYMVLEHKRKLCLYCGTTKTSASSQALQQKPTANFSMGYRSSVTTVFLLAVIIIAQSAPMKNKRDKGVPISDKTQEFYCTSELIKLQVQHMVKVYVVTYCVYSLLYYFTLA